MITRFGVQNYKALLHADLNLSPLHVLIGPNDSGKTSVLEALLALCESANPQQELSSAFGGRWKGRELIWKREPSGQVTLAAETQDSEGILQYELHCLFLEGELRQVRAREEKVRQKQDPHWCQLAGLPNLQSNLARLNEIGENSLPPDCIPLARRAQNALAGAHLYQWNPRFLALPVAPDSSRQFRMEPSGFGLALVLDDILGFARDRFTELENQFREIFPDIKSIKLVRESAYRAPVDPHSTIPQLHQAEGKGLHFEFSKTGKTLPASQVSDGLLLVLAYLTVLHLPDPPRMILIEEPENGIHPKRLEDVFRILRALVKEHSRSQVVMTTHSPYVVDLFAPEEVSLCRKSDDGSVTIHQLSRSKTVRDQLDIFSLGEIWTAEGEDAILRTETAQSDSDK